jgi:DNA-binding transcriptional ArsR family regulator
LTAADPHNIFKYYNMPYRTLVLAELGALLGVLSHPARLRIVEEVRSEERDVNALRELLGIAHSSVSQHLGLLRAHHVVLERREGRHVFYRLARPELAGWLLDGLRFIEPMGEGELRSAVERARATWSATEQAAARPRKGTSARAPRGVRS